ncbi:Origin recognition complex subunit 6 [Lachnellula arida]|uniref:Origin recognition complex subunit 6 n=1 Tax=Lachnellula arida TaxID=1316785 RepID=A0A8T9BI50_9HELO|nr:Origin recognition complex subunit 6 [Lachnellula arida]
MSKPIEQALSNLIPRHPGAIPPELFDLASSLLAQSRTKASTLKAEEEIGRTYAVANIACERLKTTLNLPPIEPRPPVPPRVYSKLYTYLSRVLVSSTRRRGPAARNTPSRPLPQKQTPLKETSLASFRASNRTPKKGLKYAGNKERDERVPKWVAPVVRKMCREMENPAAVPHVLAGVESILTQPCPNGEQKMEGKVPALVAASWFFVTQELTGKETSGKEFALRCKKILGLFKEARDDVVVVGKVGDDEEAWKDWEAVVAGDVKGWVREITDNGWLELDWFTNIASGEAGAYVEEDEEDETTKRVGKREGLGTMMADRYDYLSEENRAEYAEYKRAMLVKINDLIHEGIMDMDTTDG